MTHTENIHRSGMTAIAAVLALSSTAVFAQDATVSQPVTETPATTAPVADSLAPVTTTTTTETSTEVANDPLAPAAAATTPAARTVTRRTTTRQTASVPRPARTTTAAQSAVVSPVTAAEPAPPVAVPIAPLATEMAPVTGPPAQETSLFSDDMLPIAGAAGLGLLALLGAGVAMRRRKRRDAEQFAADEWIEPALVAAPARVEPAPAIAPRIAPRITPTPAFGWNGTPARAAPVAAAAAMPEGDHGRHVEAAYRGPTPDNPSLSLKTRIKRAAFFDQRERLVAKGKAVPVEAGAGLPAAMASEASQVRDTVTARPPRPMKPKFEPA